MIPISLLKRAAVASCAALIALTAAEAQLVPEGPTYHQRRIDHMEAAEIASRDCITDDNQYSDDNYVFYIMTLIREMGMMRMSGGVLDGTVGTFDEQMGRMVEANRSLNQCRFRDESRRAAARALSGCKMLNRETNTIERESRRYLQEHTIQKGEFVNAIEMLLPAAQACRDKLGKCYNPESRQQREWAEALFAFEAYISAVTGGKGWISSGYRDLSLDLPPCSRTMLDANDDKPDPKDRDYIVYVNTTFGAKKFWTADPRAVK